NHYDRDKSPGGHRHSPGSSPAAAQAPAGPARTNRDSPDQDQHADRRGGESALALWVVLWLTPLPRCSRRNICLNWQPRSGAASTSGWPKSYGQERRSLPGRDGSWSSRGHSHSFWRSSLSVTGNSWSKWRTGGLSPNGQLPQASWWAFCPSRYSMKVLQTWYALP